MILTQTFAFLAEFTYAAETYPFFRGIRQEGMGGAGIAVVDDETALFINPAGLGKIRGSYITPFNFQAETNYITQSQMASNTGDINFATNAQAMLNNALRAPDQHIHAEAQILPAFVTTNFGMGLYGKYQSDSQLNSATNTYHLDYFNDVGAEVGYCFRLFSGRLKIGATGKVINRVYVNQDFPGSTTNLDLSAIAQEGTGIGWDGAVMLSGPWVWLPTLTAVAHDIGNTYFNLGSGLFYKTGVTPPAQYQSVDVGFAAFPILDKGTRMSITGEWRDIQNPEPQDPWRRIHTGMEINFRDVFFMRGGLNEHYWTAGLEFDIGHNQLQLASYGEEIGTPTSPLEDRRYVVQYGFRF